MTVSGMSGTTAMGSTLSKMPVPILTAMMTTVMATNTHGGHPLLSLNTATMTNPCGDWQPLRSNGILVTDSGGR